MRSKAAVRKEFGLHGPTARALLKICAGATVAAGLDSMRQKNACAEQSKKCRDDLDHRSHSFTAAFIGPLALIELDSAQGQPSFEIVRRSLVPYRRGLTMIVSRYFTDGTVAV